MIGINKCIFVGVVSCDPQGGYSKSHPDVPFARFRLRVSEQRTQKDIEPKTIYIPITSYGNEATKLIKYMKEGDRVYVEGRFALHRPGDGKDSDSPPGYQIDNAKVIFVSTKREQDN